MLLQKKQQLVEAVPMGGNGPHLAVGVVECLEITAEHILPGLKLDGILFHGAYLFAICNGIFEMIDFIVPQRARFAIFFLS